jgi:hypothetical protein
VAAVVERAPPPAGRGREAPGDAGVVCGVAPLHPRRRALAVAWLTGTLDDQVRLPVAFVCDALGLDAGVLAAAVRVRPTG